MLQIDLNRLLVVKTTNDIRLGKVFLEFRNAIEKISKIPYTIPVRKISLERKLEEVADELKEFKRNL
ncbi:hypothetical protein LCGC14_3098680 [marine sediment metagenome]|uniref:Uncharacterized protein n=1 Tax=marine sediment metagenome TaxID=412755 RepID=A0A0F8YYG8_9ZZZZ